ncbi:MAG: Mrp/NBP35 family ATP-binding protein [Zetaproteobacteria bacterium]|nr:Mrp/NBP35 family ATP-binding protein [Zetaproteobacteria bacterium]
MSATTSNPQQAKKKRPVSGLAQVKAIYAVVSGKGGVGKSSVTVMLARALQLAGYRVGILDADIYGPSIPTMTGAGRPAGMKGDFVIPPRVQDIPIVSAAMFSQGVEAHSLRGPLASQFVRQFFEQVAWGPLDYLIVDLPPGTGDIHLTMAQTVRIQGAVVVTTPQEVALQDVQRSVAHLKKVQIPVSGLVENMSGIFCPHCDQKHAFLPGNAGSILQDQLRLERHYKLYFDPEVANYADQGKLLACEQLPSAQELFVCLQTMVEDLFEVESRQAQPNFLDKFKLKWRK